MLKILKLRKGKVSYCCGLCVVYRCGMRGVAKPRSGGVEEPVQSC